MGKLCWNHAYSSFSHEIQEIPADSLSQFSQIISANTCRCQGASPPPPPQEQSCPSVGDGSWWIDKNSSRNILQRCSQLILSRSAGSFRRLRSFRSNIQHHPTTYLDPPWPSLRSSLATFRHCDAPRLAENVNLNNLSGNHSTQNGIICIIAVVDGGSKRR